jgi:hypothetical protein
MLTTPRILAESWLRRRPVLPRAKEFLLRGELVRNGVPTRHVQYVTREFVLTEHGSATELFSAREGARFAVETDRLVERRSAETASHCSHLSALLGSIRVHCVDDSVEVAGFRCARFRVTSEGGAISMTADVFTTVVPEMEATALCLSREEAQRDQPWHLPIPCDRVVVLSTTRTRSGGSVQDETFRLLELKPLVHERDRLARIQALPRSAS